MQSEHDIGFVLCEAAQTVPEILRGAMECGTTEQLRGTMVYYIHRIEKGLSHRRFRAGFGRSAFGELRSVMDEWRERDYPVDDVTYIAARQVVRAYVRKHRRWRSRFLSLWAYGLPTKWPRWISKASNKAEKADVAGKAA